MACKVLSLSGLLTLLLPIRHGHKNTVLALEWNQNGNWLVTAGRDQLVKVYDIRTMKELQIFRGHKKEICCK